MQAITFKSSLLCLYPLLYSAFEIVDPSSIGKKIILKKKKKKTNNLLNIQTHGALGMTTRRETNLIGNRRNKEA